MISSDSEDDSDDGGLPTKRHCDDLPVQQDFSRLDSGVSLQSFVSNLIKCAVCLETFVEPRSLRCLHTFCRRCLESVHENSYSSTIIICPTCRQSSKIPPAGVLGFPHNFIVQNLVTADQGTSEYCGQHTHDIAVEFCFDCSALLCEVCVEDHPLGHNVRPMKDAIRQFNQQISDAAGKINDFNEFENYAKQLEKEKELITGTAKTIIRDINDRALIMKRAIEKHVELLVKFVTDHETKILQEIQNKLSSVYWPKDYLQELKTEAKKLKTEFKLSELSSAIADFETNVQELRNELSSLVIENYRCPLVHFQPAPSQQVIDVFNFRKNCIGSIKVVRDKDAHPYRMNTHLTAKIRVPVYEDDSLVGIAQLDGKLFAIIPDPLTIAAFSDQSPYSRLPDVAVDGMISPVCMVACKHSSCLFVADRSALCVWRVRPDHGIVDKFICLRSHLDEDTSKSLALSVKSGRLVVTVPRLGLLLFFGCDGEQLHSVETTRAQRRCTPVHAIETARETAFVCFYGDEDVGSKSKCMFSDNCICEIDKVGNLLQEYNLGEHQVRRLALVGDGNVLCADIEEADVLILSDKFKFMGSLLSSSGNHGFFYPLNMSYDDATGQLLLGNSDNLFLYHIK